MLPLIVLASRIVFVAAAGPAVGAVRADGAVAVIVTKIDGTQQSGVLAAWSANALTLRKGQQTVTLAPSELLRVRWRGDSLSSDAEKTFVELVDGTRLPHESFEVQAGTATLTTSLADQGVTISTDQIRFVQLMADAEPQSWSEQEQAGDQLLLRKKNGKSPDSLTGVVGNVSSEQIDFNWDGEVIPVKRSKVAALTYYHANRPPPVEPVCWLKLHDGTRLPVMQIRLAGTVAEVRTAAGLDVSIPLESLREADYSQGKLAYLSDLSPLAQQWDPRISLPASAALIRRHGLPRRDQSFSGSALTLFWPESAGRNTTPEHDTLGHEKPGNGNGETGNGEAGDSNATHGEATAESVFGGKLVTYSKGLALRSRTEIRYRVPAGMQRFVTLAGIDPETAAEGHVVLEIFAGRQSIWQGEFDGNAVPTEINVPIGNARELRLVVDYGANLDFGDRLHLAEARLSQ